MIAYCNAKTNSHFNQILDLQRINLKSSLTAGDIKNNGFVTLKHDIKLLKELNNPYPHIIALDNDKVVGYALVTTSEKTIHIPLLNSTIQELINVEYNQRKILDLRYFIMGQVCVDKLYRGQGVFIGLYQKMINQMKTDYDMIITEIATENTRSMKAHQKIGFEILKIHNDGAEWAIVGLDIQKN